jgi:glycine/D-amino acid oxidase-like deaminating enzyme
MSNQKDLNIDRHTPFWWDAAMPRRDVPSTFHESCDVAIVGAGYTGLAAAIVLAREGKSVQVFDRQRPGEGASSRNGGIMSGNIRISLSKGFATIGEQRILALYREGKAAREDLWRFVNEEGIDCDFNLAGRFTGAMTDENYEGQAREAELLNKHLDIGAEMVPPDRQHEEVGSQLYRGGMSRPDVGHLHPGKLHAGMLRVALEAGVIVHGETPVSRVEKSGSHYGVTTTKGVVKAGDVLMATNGYGDSVDAWLRRRIVPVKSRIVVTEPLSPNLMQHLMPKQRSVAETRKLYRYYRPSPDGTRIMFGGRETITSNDNETNIEHLRKGLVEVFPELADVKVDHSWNGFVAFNRDDLPRLFTHDGVHYACSYCGSGVVWARWLGGKAAYRILGRSEATSELACEPPASIPLYWGKPWFMPIAMAWYGFQDRQGRNSHRLT